MQTQTAEIPYSYRLCDGIAYLTRNEVDLIKEMARLLPPDAVCCNIGAGAATSIIALLEERPELYVYSIDIDPDNGMSQLHESGFISRIIQIVGDSKKVEWQYGKIDYTFVDGEHSYEGILGDIRAFLPRMAENGIMLFDDYADIHWSSVKQIVDLYAGKWEQLGYVDNLIAFRVNRGNE